MRYSGSKKNIIKHIIPFLYEHLNGNNYYIEPFVGGCNSFSAVSYDKKIGYDSNPYVIEMWKHFQMGGKPIMDLTEKEYYDIKNDYINKSLKYPYWVIGYVGNACSYGSAWFNGYAKFNEKRKENHILESYNGTLRQIENFKFFKESSFICNDYSNIEVPKGSVIYCDPPYEGTKGYMDGNFDSKSFWDWCIQKKEEGCHVYVSEYNAPEMFTCIWQKEKHDGMGTTKLNNRQNIKIEKLFTLL